MAECESRTDKVCKAVLSVIAESNQTFDLSAFRSATLNDDALKLTALVNIATTLAAELKKFNVAVLDAE